MRSLLTTLGIVIGIVTVTLMGTAIEGLNRSFMQSVSSIGADVLYAQRMDWMINSYEEWIRMSKRRPFTLAQANSAMRTIDFAAAMAPMADSGASIRNKDRDSDYVGVLGTTDEYAIAAGISIQDGRFISAAEADGGR